MLRTHRMAFRPKFATKMNFVPVSQTKAILSNGVRNLSHVKYQSDLYSFACCIGLNNLRCVVEQVRFCTECSVYCKILAVSNVHVRIFSMRMHERLTLCICPKYRQNFDKFVLLG